MMIQRNFGLSEKDSSTVGATHAPSCNAKGNLMEQHNYRPLNI